ncbi:MAG: hypothetical protein A3A86_00860 [Elusimicrobia bacterium RIFCSPLOWO2_01_FULL_60_11]|nr:MAG: hypothetical protein A3A86_00860 [Elusimicrobia bacterium RIFCSPLOWO2_01_FULL_60_11]
MIWALPFLIVFVAVLWSYLSSNLIMQIPRYPLEANPRAFGHEFEPFTVAADDGVRLEGWFVPAKKTSSTTIFALHGWGANRSDVLAHTVFLGEKYNLVYFDFRNHGSSGGALSSLTCSEIGDFMSVVKHVRQDHAGAARQMAVFGFSMGASVAISGSTKMQDIRAVVAESPFASFNETVIRFAHHFYGIPRFIIPLTLIAVRMRLGFDPEDCAPLYLVDKLSPRPLFIIQGAADQRMPVTEGEGIYETARQPKEIWVIPGADHGEAFDKAGPEYQKRILDFYAKWLN